MNYHIYLAKHNETDKVFVGRTTRLPIKLSFRDSNRRGAGELGQLLREGGLGKFTLTLIDTVSTAEEASKKFNALVAELDCYEPKGLNHNQFGDRNSRYGVRWKGHKGRKLVSTPWKYPLGSKPWHRLPPDMVYQPQILGRIPRSQSVTHYVRREVGNGVTDYMTLLNGIIAGLRDGSILPKPESWLIIHSIIKQTLMAKVYTPQGYHKWSQLKFAAGAPKFPDLPALALDLNIRLGKGYIPPELRSKRGRPPKKERLPTAPKVKVKRYISPDNLNKLISGLKKYHAERKLRGTRY